MKTIYGFIDERTIASENLTEKCFIDIRSMVHMHRAFNSVHLDFHVRCTK